jgi:hypothetical protein
VGKLITKALKLVGVNTDTKPPAKRVVKDPIMQEAIEQLGYYGLYVIAPHSGWPVAFGYAKDHADAWAALKRGHWEYHKLWYFPWVPGKEGAQRVKNRMVKECAPLQQFDNPEWYNMTAQDGMLLYAKIAREEGVAIMDHVQWAKDHERVADEIRTQRKLDAPPVAKPILKIAARRTS